MTTKQRRGVLKFHEKMAAAYRAVGKVEQAEVAETMAGYCRAALKETP